MGNSIAMKCGTPKSVKAKCKEKYILMYQCYNDRSNAFQCVQKEAMKLVSEDFVAELFKSFRTSDVKGFVTSIKRFASNDIEFYKAALQIDRYKGILDRDRMW